MRRPRIETFDLNLLRTFDAVFQHGSVNSAAGEIVDPEATADNVEVRTFEIGEIKRVSLTEQPFIIDPAIDRYDGMYENGIVCSAD